MTNRLENLFDCCCNYIENAHTGDGEMTANESIYNMRVDYINGLSSTPRDTIEKLNKIFKFN